MGRRPQVLLQQRRRGRTSSERAAGYALDGVSQGRRDETWRALIVCLHDGGRAQRDGWDVAQEPLRLAAHGLTHAHQNTHFLPLK